jgi:formylglycine-generating enzyme required for sulfatase activity
MNEPIKVFLSYSHQDDELKKEFCQHLAILYHNQVIASWDDRNIDAGSEWANAIDQNLEQAEIILLLVSSAFIASRYCYSIEMEQALKLHKTGAATVIPVIIRESSWTDSPLGQLQAVPRDNRAVAKWGDKYARDSAWTEVTEEIGKVALQIKHKRNAASTAAQKAKLKQEFRAKAEDFYKDGVLSPGEEALLEMARQGLEEAEAEEILQAVKTAYQQHQTNLERYRKTLRAELADQDELRDDQRVLLQQLQAEFKISDPEADRIEREVWTDRVLVPQPVQELPDSQAQMLAQQNPAAVERNDDRDGGGERFLKAMSEFLGSEKAQEIHTKVLEKRQKESENRLKNQEFAPDRTNLNLQTFSFEVVLLDDAGKERKRTTEQAQYFAEVLAPGVDLHMVSIPGGSFRMGSPYGKGDDNEQPQHLVNVAPFFMGKFPVTQRQWNTVVNLDKIRWDLWFNEYVPEHEPVRTESRDKMDEFCARLSHFTKKVYLLPSEAEWEYACRAGTLTNFHFGEKISRKFINHTPKNISWFDGLISPPKKNSEVGALNVANSFGLYDMHGNVREMCQDYWYDNYEKACRDGIPLPCPPPSREGLRYVTRGGAFSDEAEKCRSAARLPIAMGGASYETGFRVGSVN